MRRLGSRVTVCEGNERILGGEDPDIAEAILKLLQDEGIELSPWPMSTVSRAGPAR
jgi:pyruvate/2-oxoglutarate dehydrogenase complex dihydrolipoamide dehydrogenase (E3) component